MTQAANYNVPKYCWRTTARLWQPELPNDLSARDASAAASMAKRMLPGLIAHGHAGLGFLNTQLDLTATKSSATALTTIKGYSRIPGRLDSRARLEPGDLETRPLSNCPRTRCRDRQSPGVAQARRWPRRLGQQRGAAGGRH
jgi:hypothetical protein